MYEIEICYTIYGRVEKRTFQTQEQRDMWVKWWENNPNCHWVRVL